MWTGLAAPSRIGPTVIPCPATILRALKVAFGGIQVRHDQEVRLGRKPCVREDAVEHRPGERRIGMHLAFDLEIRGRGA